jgi:hypothetical protein
LNKYNINIKINIKMYVVSLICKPALLSRDKPALLSRDKPALLSRDKPALLSRDNSAYLVSGANPEQ